MRLSDALTGCMLLTFLSLDEARSTNLNRVFLGCVALFLQYGRRRKSSSTTNDSGPPIFYGV